MSSFYIGWSGILHDNDLQQKLVEALVPLAQSFNEIYFGDKKNDTTFEIFDNRVIDAKILVSKSLFDLPTHPIPTLVEQIYSDTFGDKKNELDDFVVVNRITLNGFQFKVFSDPCDLFDSDENMSRISFVFASFEAKDLNGLRLKNNIVEVRDKKQAVKYNDIRQQFEKVIFPSGISFRHCNMSYLESICAFVKHYYISEMVLEPRRSSDPLKLYLEENDPFRNSREVQGKAVEYLINEACKQAESWKRHKSL